jgi:hypothetical protein
MVREQAKSYQALAAMSNNVLRRLRRTGLARTEDRNLIRSVTAPRGRMAAVFVA